MCVLIITQRDFLVHFRSKQEDNDAGWDSEI